MHFIVEIDRCDFDLIFLSETWRHEVEETVLTPGGNKLFLAGGVGHGGVGFCISRQLCSQMWVNISCFQFSVVFSEVVFSEICVWEQKVYSPYGLCMLFSDNMDA